MGVTNIGYIPFASAFSKILYFDAPIDIANILKESFKEIRKTFREVDWKVSRNSPAVQTYKDLIYCLTNTNSNTLNFNDFMSLEDPSSFYYQFHLPQFEA